MVERHGDFCLGGRQVTEPLVTFGVINCNRLHYMRSCIESLIQTTDRYTNKELIVVDNASTEPGTKEYFQTLRQNWKNYHLLRLEIIENPTRDPSNEFAKGLNSVVQRAAGTLICPLQGDMQFVENDWLFRFVKLFEVETGYVGCAMLDAQRRVTLKSSKLVPCGYAKQFFYDLGRPPVAGAGDVMYDRAVLEALGPWSTSNLAHEGGNDSETEFLKRSAEYVAANKKKWMCAMAAVPPACAIYTDARGTNARIRGNRRYGDYWAPKNDGNLYYEIKETPDEFRMDPLSIEQMAHPIGFTAPIGFDGGWLKNPIRPEMATSREYVELDEKPKIMKIAEDEYLKDWMNG